MLYLTVGKLEGFYSYGEALFKSDTNSVNVEILGGSRGSVFTLDVRSTSSCTVKEDFCDDTVQAVRVGAGEVLLGALSTHQNDDGNYPNNVCQYWNVITDENQVYFSVTVQ